MSHGTCAPRARAACAWTQRRPPLTVSWQLALCLSVASSSHARKARTAMPAFAHRACHALLEAIERAPPQPCMHWVLPALAELPRNMGDKRKLEHRCSLLQAM